MKYFILLSSLYLLMCSPKEARPKVIMPAIEYPDALQKVFDTHGSLDKWKSYRTISYNIGESADDEHQVIDLNDRRERIDASDFTMGYDGTGIWLTADTTYKGNPVFYKNLMFYFYAMPFVLADPGIEYKPVDDLVYGGTNYPGYKISYGDGIGESPEDEYFIHYNPESYQMEWLGYTVTYFSGKKSPTVKWIRYDDWQDLEGVKLPASMEWYENENNLPKTPKSRRVFTHVNLSKQKAISGTYDKIPEAEYVEGE